MGEDKEDIDKSQAKKAEKTLKRQDRRWALQDTEDSQVILGSMPCPPDILSSIKHVVNCRINHETYPLFIPVKTRTTLYSFFVCLFIVLFHFALFWLWSPGTFYFFIVFFPLPFSSLIPLHPLQSPHCCPCSWIVFPFCSVPPLPLPLNCHPALHLWVCLYFVC